MTLSFDTNGKAFATCTCVCGVRMCGSVWYPLSLCPTGMCSDFLPLDVLVVHVSRPASLIVLLHSKCVYYECKGAITILKMLPMLMHIYPKSKILTYLSHPRWSLHPHDSFCSLIAGAQTQLLEVTDLNPPRLEALFSHIHWEEVNLGTQLAVEQDNSFLGEHASRLS